MGRNLVYVLVLCFLSLSVLVLLIFTTSFSLTVSEISSSAVAKILQKRYEDKTEECYDHAGRERPLYECTGILIRGVDASGSLWNLAQFNKDKQSLGLSFLRQDINWNRHAFSYESGFILYPRQNTPARKNTYQGFCAFPLDGYTYNRDGAHACGKFIEDDLKTWQTFYNESDYCDKYGIVTFDDWKEHFERVGRESIGSTHYFHRAQCGFDMWEHRGMPYDAPEWFQLVMKANRYLNTTTLKEQTIDIVINFKAWNEEEAHALPIEAFFYVAGCGTGEATAREYQRSFEMESGGEKVPIVSIHFPSRNEPFKVQPVDFSSESSNGVSCTLEKSLFMLTCLMVSYTLFGNIYLI